MSLNTNTELLLETATIKSEGPSVHPSRIISRNIKDFYRASFGSAFCYFFLALTGRGGFISAPGGERGLAGSVFLSMGKVENSLGEIGNKAFVVDFDRVVRVTLTIDALVYLTITRIYL